MHVRPIELVWDATGAYVKVDVGPSGLKAFIEIKDFDQAVGRRNLSYIKSRNGKYFPTISTRKTAGGHLVLARILTGALPHEVVTYRNGCQLDLRRQNITLKRKHDYYAR